MGCIKTITHDRFPEQSKRNGVRVKVCYHYDTKHYHYGEIIRDDREEPFETIIKLDNGRYIRATECQYAEVDQNGK